MKRPDSALDTLWRSASLKRYVRAMTRYRGVLLVLLVPVLLIVTVLAILPRTSTLAKDPTHTLQDLQNHKSGVRFAVVFDAGSTGSRVHVFKFLLEDGRLKLESDTFEQLKPGLSSYADDPAKAAASIQPLLDTALKTVPKELQRSTPVSLKATAGLRLLPGDKADKILLAVEEKLKTTPFKLSEGAVAIMDGKDEGAFAWLTLNYLLGKLGGAPLETVSAVDLGGGSVQEAFAMTHEQAASAPKELVTKLHGNGKAYHVYVHSYLGYGLMAARAKVIETAAQAKKEAAAEAAAGHPCYGKGSESVYQYAGKDYAIKPAGDAADFKQCVRTVTDSLQVQLACGTKAPQEECTFSGVWRGKRPQEALYYISSYFWDRALDTGIIQDEKATVWSTAPSEFAKKAQEVCSKSSGSEALQAAFPRASKAGLAHLCADLTYCAQLLVAGFKMPPSAQITLVKQIEYNGALVEAAWPLGAAVNDLSSAA